jgi:nanoRNase/pAp phosphatase (c-di-AMP/oligoRNAs hydrolase)
MRGWCGAGEALACLTEVSTPVLLELVSSAHLTPLLRRSKVCGDFVAPFFLPAAIRLWFIYFVKMTAFVDTCVQTVAGSADAVQRNARSRPRAAKLLRALEGKRRILITTHMHPDPDALASSLALCVLLGAKLKDAVVSLSVKGQVGGGLNTAFTRYTTMELTPWDDAALASYEAIILLDSQPNFAYSPLPAGVVPTAVIDHHPARGRKPKCAFCDIRTEVGATSSIVFSYFMELQTPIPPDLSATLLYAIESDLAGAAGTPTQLDNIALSSLTLTADTRKLYQMRYVDLPQSYYIAYSAGLGNAMYFDDVMISHIDQIDSLEKPAVIADFLLRFEKVQWSLVTAVHGSRLVMSLRTSSSKGSAGETMRRMVGKLGVGGGHRSKAGGYIPLENGSAAEIDRIRKKLKGRLLSILKIHSDHGQRLVPHAS